MKYWILQHNPELLPEDIDWPSGVAGTRDYWHISRYENDVEVDDIAFIWHAGSNRGIYNIAHIVSVPPHTLEAKREIGSLQDNDAPYWIDKRKRFRK